MVYCINSLGVFCTILLILPHSSSNDRGFVLHLMCWVTNLCKLYNLKENVIDIKVILNIKIV